MQRMSNSLELSPTISRPMKRNFKQLKKELNQEQWEAAANTLRDILKSKKCNRYALSPQEGEAILTAFDALFTHLELSRAFQWYRTCWSSLKMLLPSAEFTEFLSQWLETFLQWSERLIKIENGFEKAHDLYQQLLSWSREQNKREWEIQLLYAEGNCYLHKREFSKAAVQYELARALSKMDELPPLYLQQRELLLAYLIYEKTLKGIDFDHGQCGELVWFDHHIAWLYQQQQWHSLSTFLSILVWTGDTLYRANALLEAENCYRTLRALINHETPQLEMIEKNTHFPTLVKETFKKLTLDLFHQQEVEEKLSHLKIGKKFLWSKENTLAFPFPWLGDKKPLEEVREKAMQTRHLFFHQSSHAPAYQEAWKTYLTARENYLAQLFKQIIVLLGEPSCAYNVFALGSSGRQEACPYSDIEYAIGLAPHPIGLEKYNPEIDRQYFDLVCHLFHMTLLALGEPDPKYLGASYSTTLPKGFRTDEGGNTPIDKRVLLLPISPSWPGDKGTLVGKSLQLQGNIPQERKKIIADLEGIILADIVLASNILDGYSLLGRESQARAYVEQIEQALNDVPRGATPPFPLREALAVALLKKCDALTSSQVLNEKCESCNVKKDVLELPVYLLKTLAIYYGISPSITNSIGRAQALAEQGYLAPTLATALITFLRFAQALRLSAHLHYQDENDTVYFNAHSALNDGLILKPEHQETLFLFYQCLLVPLTQAAQEFLAKSEQQFVSQADNPFSKESNFAIITFVMSSLQSCNNTNLSVEGTTLFLQATVSATHLPVLVNTPQPTSLHTSYAQPQLLALLCLQHVLEKNIYSFATSYQEPLINMVNTFHNTLSYLALNLKLHDGLEAEQLVDIMQALAMDGWVGKASLSIWQTAWDHTFSLQEILTQENAYLSQTNVSILHMLFEQFFKPLLAQLKAILAAPHLAHNNNYRKLLYAVTEDYFNKQALFTSLSAEEALPRAHFQLQMLTQLSQKTAARELTLARNWQEIVTQAKIKIATIQLKQTPFSHHDLADRKGFEGKEQQKNLFISSPKHSTEEVAGKGKISDEVSHLLHPYENYLFQPLYQAIFCSETTKSSNLDPLLGLCETLGREFVDYEFTLSSKIIWRWQQQALSLLQALPFSIVGLGKILPHAYVPPDTKSTPFDKLVWMAHSAIFTQASKDQHLAYYQTLPRVLRLPWFVLLLKAIHRFVLVEKEHQDKKNTEHPLNMLDFSFYHDLLVALAYQVDSRGWRLIRDLQQAVWHQQLLSLVEEIELDAQIGKEQVTLWMQNLNAPWDITPKRYKLRKEVQQQLFTGLKFKPRNAAQKGNHTVLPIKVGELTFYCKLCPEQPVMEALIEQLAWAVSPGGTPSSIAVKFQHGNLATAALLSAKVEGTDLEWALTHDPEQVKGIEPSSFLQTLLRVLLSNPEDDKADDYFLAKTGSTYRLVRIDNERAYYQPDIENSSKWVLAKRQLQVKSILYCFDQMQTLISPYSSALQDFCAIDPLLFLESWVATFTHLHHHYQQLFTETDIKRHFILQDADLQAHFAKGKIKESICLLAAGLAPELLKEQLNRWTSLQTVIRLAQQQAECSLDGITLLRSVQPQLASYYRHVFDDYPVTKEASDAPLKRFDKATYGLYKVRKGAKGGYRETFTPGNKAITRSLQLKKEITLDDALAITRGELYSPVQIEKELKKLTAHRADDIIDDFHHLRGQEAFRLSPVRQQQQIVTALIQEAKDGKLTLEQQRYLLQAMAGLPWHDLRLQPLGQSLTDDLLAPLLNGAGQHLRVLQLSGTAITAHTLNLIAKSCPQLQTLELHHLPALTLVGEKNTDFLRRLHYKPFELLQLQALTIRDCESLQTIRLNTPRLARIVIKACPALEEITWENAMLSNLVQAKVRGCAKLTTLTLPAPWLQVARITYNPQLEHIHMTSEQLQELQLQGCTGLGSDLVKVLMTQSPEQLQRVSLPNSRHLRAYIEGDLAQQFTYMEKGNHWIINCLLTVTDIQLRPIIEQALAKRITRFGVVQVKEEIFNLIQKQAKIAGFYYYRGWLSLRSGNYRETIADWASYVFLQHKQGESAILSIEPSLQKKLFDEILLSRDDPAASPLAAQAMTVLTAAKIAFAGKDLHAICIPGAILKGGIFDGTNFSHADLSGVNLQKAFLSHANLSHCDLRGVSFQKHSLVEKDSKITQICFSPEGRYAVSASGKQMMWLDVQALEENTSTEPQLLSFHQNDACSIAFSPDGAYFASGSKDKMVQMWDTSAIKAHLLDENKKAEVKFKADAYSYAVSSVAFSQPGAKHHSLLLATSNGSTVPLIEVNTGNLLFVVEDLKQTVTSIAFGPPNEQGLGLLAIASGKSVFLFDVVKRCLMHTLAKHKSEVTCLAFSPDGHYLASGSRDKTLLLWNLRAPDIPAKVIEQNSEVISVAFNGKLIADHYRLAISSKDKLVRIWDILMNSDNNTQLKEKIKMQEDVASMRESAVLKGHASAVLSLAFHPSGRFLATGSASHGLCLWQWQDDAYRLFWTSHPNLQTQQLNIKGATLSENNFHLLKQQGAKAERKEVHISTDMLVAHSLFAPSLPNTKSKNISPTPFNHLAKNDGHHSSSSIQLKKYVIAHGKKYWIKEQRIEGDGWCALRAAGFRHPEEAIKELFTHLNHPQVKKYLQQAIESNYQSSRESTSSPAYEPFTISGKDSEGNEIKQNIAYLYEHCQTTDERDKKAIESAKQAFDLYLQRPEVQNAYLSYILKDKYANHSVVAACLAMQNKKLALFADFGGKAELTNLTADKIDIEDGNTVCLSFDPSQHARLAHYNRAILQPLSPILHQSERRNIMLEEHQAATHILQREGILSRTVRTQGMAQNHIEQPLQLQTQEEMQTTHVQQLD